LRVSLRVVNSSFSWIVSSGSSSYIIIADAVSVKLFFFTMFCASVTPPLA
jgi:hypothetical protein